MFVYNHIPEFLWVAVPAWTWTCSIDLNGLRTPWNWDALEPWHPPCPPATKPLLKQPQQRHHWVVTKLNSKSLQHTENATKRMIGASFITLGHLEHPPHTEKHSASLANPPPPSLCLYSAVLQQTLKLVFCWDQNASSITNLYHNITELSKWFWLHLISKTLHPAVNIIYNLKYFMTVIQHNFVAFFCLILIQTLKLNMQAVELDTEKLK